MVGMDQTPAPDHPCSADQQFAPTGGPYMITGEGAVPMTPPHSRSEPLHAPPGPRKVPTVPTGPATPQNRSPSLASRSGPMILFLAGFIGGFLVNKGPRWLTEPSTGLVAVFAVALALVTIADKLRNR